MYLKSSSLTAFPLLQGQILTELKELGTRQLLLGVLLALLQLLLQSCWFSSVVHAPLKASLS